MDKIIESKAEDWHSIICWGGDSGPSYHGSFTFYEKYHGREGVLEEDSHRDVAVYMPDVSITMAWGLHWVKDFREDWANSFPEPTATSSYVDVFYNNALVFRDVRVTVDGGRVSLPLPNRKFDKDTNKVIALEVPERCYSFIKLVHSIENSLLDYDEYCERAGFKIVKEPWPKWH